MVWVSMLDSTDSRNICERKRDVENIILVIDFIFFPVLQFLL